MNKVLLSLDPTVFMFYQTIADRANIPLDQVLANALFKLAGELSLQALKDSTYFPEIHT